MAWWPSDSCTTANRDASSRRTMKQGKESSKGLAIWRARLLNVAAALILSSTARPWQVAGRFRGRDKGELNEKSAPRQKRLGRWRGFAARTKESCCLARG